MSGGLFPIQLIESKKLSEEEKRMLRDLRNDLDAQRFTEMIGDEELARKYPAYRNVLVQGNPKAFVEAEMMLTDAIIDEVIEKNGYKARKTQELARIALREGATVDFVSRLTGLDLKTVQGLAQTATHTTSH